jgi:hypothetical protein
MLPLGLQAQRRRIYGGTWLRAGSFRVFTVAGADLAARPIAIDRKVPNDVVMFNSELGQAPGLAKGSCYPTLD